MSNRKSPINIPFLLFLLGIIILLYLGCQRQGGENQNAFQVNQKEVLTFVEDTSEYERTLAKVDTLYGIDISHWNGNLLTDILPKNDLSFVICKATQGISFQDPDFKKNWKAIPEKGWIRGAYHFYVTNENPVEQAEYFWRTIQPLSDNDIAPIVDIEEGSLTNLDEVDLINLQVDFLQFLNRLAHLSNRTPIVYVNLYFANKYLLNSSFAKYPLWLAEYTGDSSPVIPETWKNKGYKFWQKSDYYSMDSYKTDFDVFIGKRSELYIK